MAFYMEVGLGPGHIVLDRDPALLPKNRTKPPIFGPFLLSPNGWMDQDGTWYGLLWRYVGLGPGPGVFVFDGDLAIPRTEGTPTTTQFLAHVYCGQTAGWMKAPLGTEVDLGPGHIVLDGVPPLLETGTGPPIFSVHVYCGHGRPPQLLLSSCSLFLLTVSKARV